MLCKKSAASSGSMPGGVTSGIVEAGGSGFDGITRVPAAELEVVGNAKVSQELLLGNMDQTAINALTASNGMMVYNTTTNKFQGYENGAWTNLI